MIFYLGSATFKSSSGETVRAASDSESSLAVGCAALIVIENAVFGQIPPPLPQVTH